MERITVILILLGAVQGIAEFLPISSSGHLVILEQAFSFTELFGEKGNLIINVSLHIASFCAILIFLRKEIMRILSGFFRGIFGIERGNPGYKIAVSIVTASIPAGIIGVVFHDFLEKIFSSALYASVFLIINGIILIITKKIAPDNRKLEETGIKKAFLIGLFQSVAILPGISRSGMTITGGIFCGLEPVEAARFSFLIALPVIAGAGLLEGVKAVRAGAGFNPVPVGMGMAVAFAVSLLAMKLLFAAVKKEKLHYFGYYTILAGSISLLITCLLK